MSDYRPINCSYYDELEAVATQRKPVQIIYKGEDGTRVEVHTRIKDLYTSKKEEFAVLETGLELRLDRLISVGGKLRGEGECKVS